LLTAGLSSSLEEQLKQVLAIVERGLQSVSRATRVARQREIRHSENEEAKRIAYERRRERIMKGMWHDGRLDCVAGNGVMSELGFGDERLDDDRDDGVQGYNERVVLMEKEREVERDRERKKRSVEEGQAVASLPIVVIKNFAPRGGNSKEQLTDVLADWATSLVERQVSAQSAICDMPK
jgi:hypothetical protein